MPFARSRFKVAWLKMAGIFSLVRVGSLWYLLYREWSHQQGLETLPLVVLLLPEGLMLPSNVVWTTGQAAWFTIILIAGSVVWGALFVGVVQSVVAIMNRGGER